MPVILYNADVTRAVFNKKHIRILVKAGKISQISILIDIVFTVE